MEKKRYIEGAKKDGEKMKEEITDLLHTHTSSPA